MNVHKGEGGQAHIDACGQREGSKPRFSCGRHKWMTPAWKALHITMTTITSYYHTGDSSGLHNVIVEHNVISRVIQRPKSEVAGTSLFTGSQSKRDQWTGRQSMAT